MSLRPDADAHKSAYQELYERMFPPCDGLDGCGRPMPEATAAWRNAIARLEGLARREDWMTPDTPPPEMPREELRRLIGALCRREVREAVLRILAPDLIELINARINARPSKRGAA